MLATENEIRAALGSRNWTTAATALGKLEILDPEHSGMEAFRRELTLGQQNEKAFKSAVAETEKAVLAGDLASATSALSLAKSLAPPGRAILSAPIALPQRSASANERPSTSAVWTSGCR